MNQINNLMIVRYNITDIDFMGYSINKNNFNYHHVIIPNRNGGKRTLNNGVILNQYTSHPYLHIVEAKDYEVFYRITREMIKELRAGHLVEKNLKAINELLNYFEREHSGDVNFSGEPLIKEEYTIRLYKAA